MRDTDFAAPLEDGKMHIAHACCLATVLLLAAGTAKGEDITVAPEKVVTETAPGVEHSRISILAKASVAALRQKADAAIPDPVAVFDGSQGGCLKRKIAGIKVSLGCEWHGSVTRRGALALTAQGSTLVMSLPIHVTATVKTRGEIKVQETAEADLTIFAEAQPQLLPDWSLKLNLKSDFRWDKPPTLMLFNVIPVTISSLVEPRLREQLVTLEAGANEALGDLKLAQKVGDAWRELHAPLRLSQDHDVWLSVAPKSVGFSGITAADDILAASAEINAELSTVLGAKPDNVPETPLPPLAAPSGEAGKFSLRLPVFLHYAALEQEAGKLLKLGEEWDLAIPGVPAKIKVTELDIYPTGDRITLALTVAIDGPGPLDASGIVYLIGRPVIDNDTKTLRVESFELTPAANAIALNIAASVLKPSSLLPLVDGQLKLSFAEEYEKLRQAANAALNREIAPDVRMEGALDSAVVDLITPGSEAIRVDLRASGSLTAMVGM